MDRKHSRTGLPYHAETLALGYGYDPFLSEGSLKPPAFLTSSFQFRSAEEGESHFALAYRLRERAPREVPGLIYSRLNNPNIEIFEQRLAAWDQTEQGAVFSSGMAAISSLCLSLLRPGDVVLASAPIYGGTHYLLRHVLPSFGIETHQAPAGLNTRQHLESLATTVGEARVRLVLLETPANPSNTMIDVADVAEFTHRLPGTPRGPAVLAVDNTFLGPVFQQPARLGADLVVYSATKFIAGHSDLIAGVVTGPAALIGELALTRTILGTVASPFSGWLLLRSLETLAIRMRQQCENAQHLAGVLAAHPAVGAVHYPSLLPQGSAERQLYERQCSGPGSLIAFELKGGKAAAQRVLNHFEVARLAVSLGGTETLVEHPATMTHADVPPAELATHGVGPGMIRMSVGLEHPVDLERDLLSALGA